MSIRAAVHRVDSQGVHEKIGYVTFQDTPDGLLVTPELSSLPPGFRGFHIHEFGDIEPKDGKAAGMAGQHYDPLKTGQHCGPYGHGHLGDLPRLFVDRFGRSSKPVLAPRLMLSEVAGRAIVVHSGGDNYSDHPVVNGGGRSRIAAGIISNDCPYCEDTSMKMGTLVALLGIGYLASRR